MRLRQVAVATALGLVVPVLAVAPASARAAVERDGHHFPVSVETTVPAGGYTSIATPGLPRDAKVLTVKVKPPSDASDADEEAFKNLTQVLGYMSRKKRLLTCLEFHKYVMSDLDDSEYAQINEENAVPALLILGACLQAAGLLTPEPRATIVSRAATTRPCHRRPFQLPAEMTKGDGGYRIEVDGTASKPKKLKLRAACKVKGKTYTYKVRAAEKGTPLRKVAGRRLGIGLRSPAGAGSSAPVVVTFGVR